MEHPNKVNDNDLADKINNEQIEAAKKAGKEYQGRENEPKTAPAEPDAKRTEPTVHADDDKAPASAKEEQAEDLKAATVKK